jgi:hypothetical protein
MKASTRWRTTAALVTLIAAVAFAGGVASDAEAQGVTWEQLAAHGWTCFVPPPFPERVSCFNTGLGRPFPGNPDPRPSYSFLTFDRSSGALIGNGHLIREDLYSGQPCGPSGAPYDYRALIGYYECVHLK